MVSRHVSHTSPQGGPPARKRRAMKAKGATVTASRRISPDLIRLSFDCPDIVGADLPFTDHYIKLLFVPEGAPYQWPYDLQQVREEQPREFQPIMRTYTLRRVDTERGTFDVDFVVHGEEGVAGPWAARTQVGESLGFAGPGGAWAPRAQYEHVVLAGDESAAPANCAGLEQLHPGQTADVYLEVAAPESTFEVPSAAGVRVHWVYRNGATHGTELIRALRAAGYPDKKTDWFIHGVAEMVKETRRFLFVEGGVAKQDASISGYWRLGMTEDQWQASKREFHRQNEEEEAAAQQK